MATAVSRAPAPTAERVRIGDRVQVQTGVDARVRLVLLTADRDDPDLGVISVKHPAGAALLGAGEDDEVEFDIDGKIHNWLVVAIDRERQPA